MILKQKEEQLLVNPVREAPAAMRVGISVAGVYEAVLEWAADVMS